MTKVDLDTFERPGKAGQFKVTLGGKEYTLRDAQDIDYRELLSGHEAFARGDPRIAIESVVAVEDREEFFGNVLPSYKLEAMFASYNDHFGIDPGKVPASPLS
jgi:hypothetical protein